MSQPATSIAAAGSNMVKMVKHLAFMEGGIIPRRRGVL
jgi:hypothetical protein